MNKLSLALFVLFGLVIGAAAGSIALGFDEAYNLNLAATLAGSGKYATHLESGYRWFDPAVSTGPALTLPLALALRLGGENLWVVRAAMALIFLLSLVVAYAAAGELFARPVALLFSAVFFTLPYVLYWGLSAQGDVPAAALALACLALLDRSARMGGAARSEVAARSRLLALSGVCLGLAALFKEISLLLWPALFVVGLWAVLRRRAWLELLPALTAAALPLGWRGFQWTLMQFAGEATRAGWAVAAKTRAADMWLAVIFAPFSHVQAAWQSSVTDFGALLLAAALAGAVLAWLASQRQLPAAWFTPGRFVLVASGAAWLLWFYFLSGPQANNRHNLTVYAFCALLALNVAHFSWGTADALAANSRRGAAWATRILAVALLLCLAASAWRGLAVAIPLVQKQAARLENQLAVADWVAQNTRPGSALSGYGWFAPWDIAFLSHRTPAQADLHSPELPGLTEWFVLTPEVGATGNFDAAIREFLAQQSPPALDLGGYKIYHLPDRVP